jgi:YbbR-like protein
VSLLRGLLLENLGLKLVALLLAVLVYLNVYLDRPADIVMAFPVEIDDLPDSLALGGPPPGPVLAELRGTGKQLLRLRITEPAVKISLAGQRAGRMHRAIVAGDLPVGGPDSVQVTRLIGPDAIELAVERRIARDLPVAVRVIGAPATGWRWEGSARTEPARVTVTGPRTACAGLDSVRLGPVRIAGRRDSVRAEVTPAGLPSGCDVKPATVRVVVPLVRAGG